jgi:hypothetical protein
MKRRVALLALLAIGTLGGVASALWRVSNHGNSPATWPKELEPLRKGAGTIQGGELDMAIHHLTFAKREEFEAAWPHLVAIKTKGAPIVLVRGPGTLGRFGMEQHFGKTTAGVLVHCPPGGKDPDKPVGPAEGTSNFTTRWRWTTWIELVVDGDVVDLNRIPLPADTPIVDRRFGDEEK